MLVRGEDVAQVGTVEDVFQRGEDAYPRLGANGAWDESGASAEAQKTA